MIHEKLSLLHQEVVRNIPPARMRREIQFNAFYRASDLDFIDLRLYFLDRLLTGDDRTASPLFSCSVPGMAIFAGRRTAIRRINNVEGEEP